MLEDTEGVMRYQVLLTEGAERDLEEIYDYIEKFDSAKSADYLLHKLIEAAEAAGQFSGARALSTGTSDRRYPGVSPDLLQNLSARLPGDR
jgi:plasmid stabilization system protein ParE